MWRSQVLKGYLNNYLRGFQKRHEGKEDQEITMKIMEEKISRIIYGVIDQKGPF